MPCARSFSSGLGADAGSKALAPDNELHQLSLAGAMRLPKRTVLSGQLAVGRLSQDEVLAPYTINPSIPTQPLPTLNADAEADTLNLNLRAVTSPWRRVTLEGEVRFNEFDNRTDVNDYEYVITDAVPAFQTVANPTYDYERSELKLRGEYRPGRRLSAEGAARRGARGPACFQPHRLLRRARGGRSVCRARSRPGDSLATAYRPRQHRDSRRKAQPKYLTRTAVPGPRA